MANKHPLRNTIKKLEEAREESVTDILNHYGECSEKTDAVWRAIDRLIKRLEKNNFKPYGK